MERVDVDLTAFGLASVPALPTTPAAKRWNSAGVANAEAAGTVTARAVTAAIISDFFISLPYVRFAYEPCNINTTYCPPDATVKFNQGGRKWARQRNGADHKARPVTAASGCVRPRALADYLQATVLSIRGPTCMISQLLWSAFFFALIVYSPL